MLPFKISLPLPLPKALLEEVYRFDPTYKENYNKVIEDIKLYSKAATYAPELDIWHNMGSSKWYFFLPLSAIKYIVAKQRYCCEACARNDFTSWKCRRNKIRSN